ncbi:MAG: thiopurine S-methyltransferase, partial [Methylotenera sp.]|nr:thiopurine S-methyltransferase [Oligoflexia bacterium]
MKKDFWLKRWAQSEIGWHQTEVEPALIQWASGRRPGRILVPFCGKSLDLIWLKSQGHEVIGVELSELALKKFFSENAIASAQSSEGRFTVHRADGLTLFNGDFFDLTPEQLGSVDAVYDRAALIAQPPEMRNRYALK